MRFVLLSILLSFLAFAGGVSAEEQVKSDPDPQMLALKMPGTKPYYPEVIFENITGKNVTTKELIHLIGEPDFKGEHEGKVFWQYYNLEKSHEDESVSHANFLIKFDRVTYEWVTKTKDAYED